MRRWGWQTKAAESKAWSKESLGVEEEEGRSRRRMENKHLFFPGPAAHEGLLQGFPLGYSLAWPRSCPGVLQQPQSPRCLIPPSVPWEHPWLPGSLHVAPGTKAFLKADFLICCGAELGSASMQTQQQLPPFYPARAVNYSFPWIPDSLPSLCFGCHLPSWLEKGLGMRIWSYAPISISFIHLRQALAAETSVHTQPPPAPLPPGTPRSRSRLRPGTALTLLAPDPLKPIAKEKQRVRS